MRKREIKNGGTQGGVRAAEAGHHAQIKNAKKGVEDQKKVETFAHVRHSSTTCFFAIHVDLAFYFFVRKKYL